MTYAQIISIGAVTTKIVAPMLPMVLSNQYDDRQQWFDFLIAIIISPEIEDKKI